MPRPLPDGQDPGPRGSGPRSEEAVSEEDETTPEEEETAPVGQESPPGLLGNSFPIGTLDPSGRCRLPEQATPREIPRHGIGS